MLFVALVISGFTAGAQSDDETLPEYPGGEQEMQQFLIRNVHYPAYAVENNIQGKVVVEFIVDTQGFVKAAKAVHGIGYGCDEEAVRVISSMPRWKPGMQNGKPVNVTYRVYIVFRLKEIETRGKKRRKRS
jgi:TonB family protein